MKIFPLWNCTFIVKATELQRELCWLVLLVTEATKYTPPNEEENVQWAEVVICMSWLYIFQLSKKAMCMSGVDVHICTVVRVPVCVRTHACDCMCCWKSSLIQWWFWKFVLSLCCLSYNKGFYYLPKTAHFDIFCLPRWCTMLYTC